MSEEGEGTVQVLGEEISAVTHAEMRGTLEPAPSLLPGERIAHPSPFKYVIIFMILVVVTGIEIATSYLEGTITTGVIVALLLIFGFVKFVLVAAYFMHLRTDQPIFRRFFILGGTAAIVLYAVVLTSLHVF
jgi:cytochrome c oxidase subunit 4